MLLSGIRTDFWHETPCYILHFQPILGVEIIEKQTGRKTKASGWIRTELKSLALQCDDARIEAATGEHLEGLELKP